jgi:hypothetical protein
VDVCREGRGTVRKEEYRQLPMLRALCARRVSCFGCPRSHAGLLVVINHTLPRTEGEEAPECFILVWPPSCCNSPPEANCIHFLYYLDVLYFTSSLLILTFYTFAWLHTIVPHTNRRSVGLDFTRVNHLPFSSTRLQPVITCSRPVCEVCHPRHVASPRTRQ